MKLKMITHLFYDRRRDELALVNMGTDNHSVVQYESCCSYGSAEEVKGRIRDSELIYVGSFEVGV